MSRLIDADKLEPDSNGNFPYSGYDAVSCQQIESTPTVKAIPLDKVKKVREKIEDNLFVAYGEFDNPQSYYEVVKVKDVLKILDKLIESEEIQE